MTCQRSHAPSRQAKSYDQQLLELDTAMAFERYDAYQQIRHERQMLNRVRNIELQSQHLAALDLEDRLHRRHSLGGVTITMRGAYAQPFAPSHPGAYMYDHRLHMSSGLHTLIMPNQLQFAADRRRSESALPAGQEMRLRAHGLAGIGDAAEQDSGKGSRHCAYSLALGR